MKFSNQILTVLSITTSIFIANNGGIVHAAEVVCDCGLEADCDQRGANCDVAICGAGGCDQSNAGPGALCAAGGCNQDSTGPKPQCAGGGCSQRGTKNPQCAGGNCCWDATQTGGDCAAGGCDENAEACSTWAALPSDEPEAATDEDSTSGSSTVFPVVGIVAATTAACVVALL